jgi:hypothetical protein
VAIGYERGLLGDAARHADWCAFHRPRPCSCGLAHDDDDERSP